MSPVDASQLLGYYTFDLHIFRTSNSGSHRYWTVNWGQCSLDLDLNCLLTSKQFIGSSIKCDLFPSAMWGPQGLLISGSS